MQKNTSNRKPDTANRIPHTAYRLLLAPFSLLFGLIAALRRKAFQKKWLQSKTFTVPTICVGNLRVGGTGKTPHVEYIAKLLSQNHQIAILSRGYGRKTKGYINTNETLNLSSNMIGDEPMQYATKFPNVEVAVCEKRATGIQNLMQKNKNLEVVILDDAYQHLSVNYSLKILLTEYHRPFFNDFPLPAGNLRECRNAAKHADIIIVTKCPETLLNDEKTLFRQKLKVQKHQELFFTIFVYGKREKVEVEKGSKGESNVVDNNLTLLRSYGLTVLLITGIANPAPLVNHLENEFGEIYKLHFSDHHDFTKKDIEKIIRLKEKLGGENCTILTTEKDAARLQAFENMPEYQVVPIEIAFLENEACFKEKLLSLLHHHNA
jgi:tetraacyldisaccharide 4'-kinase